MAKLSAGRALSYLAPLAGRGIGRLWRPFFGTPKQSFGYVASLDAIRVRGSLRELLTQLNALIEAPHPNPLPVRTGRGSAPTARR
jgi:hypothetical protein